MEQIFKVLYQDILKNDTYTTENDDSYHHIQNTILLKQNALMNVLEKSVPHSLAYRMIEEYDLAQNKMLYQYEYRDFQFYFSAGLAVGLTATEKNLEKFRELALKIRNSL